MTSTSTSTTTCGSTTGDDTPATSVGANNNPPQNDNKTDEIQTISFAGATGGTFTLTFDGQTTAPIPTRS